MKLIAALRDEAMLQNFKKRKDVAYSFRKTYFN